MSPLYDFACPCGEVLSTSRPMTADTQRKYHEACGLDAQRIYGSVAFRRYTEHFNASVGKVVSSERQFRDELKRASEDATQKTGIPHNFVPMDLLNRIEDLPGTESQHRVRRAMGDPRFQRRKSYFT